MKLPEGDEQLVHFLQDQLDHPLNVNANVLKNCLNKSLSKCESFGF